MKTLWSLSRAVLVLGLLVSSLMVPTGVSGAAVEAPPPQGEGPRIGRHAGTGRVNFVGVDPDSPIPLGRPGDKSWTPASLAETAIRRYADDFGLGPDDSVRQMRPRNLRTGSSVRYQQFYRGIPVLAGELIVNMDAHGNLRAIIGEISPDLGLSVEPGFGPSGVADMARAAVAKVHRVEASSLSASEPSLWVYDERLLRPSERPAALVWRTEVTSVELLPIRHLVLVDAQRGQIVLHFNRVDSAKNRTVYDNANNPALGLPGGGPFRTEGGAPSGITDVNNAYDYSGHTYDFFFNNHGRDSIDDSGMGLVSTTRYCHPAYSCPYANAFWNGAQMVYGQGYASADDVVGHELTHGVTEYESGLFYYYQSGAINESFSDIWGEFIDQGNGAGNDALGVKWLMGEDVPGGAIRSMSDPTAYSDPDRMGSAYYYEGAGDNGGVHTNSGVNNKAAYLMTDGGSFNGQTVTGLGVNKVAAIYYEVQTGLLTSGADYYDLYNALYQACLNLIGGPDGIVVGDCQEVLDAVDAVEMNDQPAPDFNTDAALCPTPGQYPVYRFLDDLESGSGAWTSGASSGSDRWSYGSPYGSFAHSGANFLYADDYPAAVTDTYLAMTNPVTLPTGAYLHFTHAYGFEDDPGYYWDGGVLEYSLDGGPWTDAGSLIEVNGYDGSIYSGAGADNPLAGRQAFAADSHGYISTRVDLSAMAGDEIRFRWRMGLDSLIYDWGWWLDDVAIYNCVTPTFNDVPPDHWAFVYIELIYQDGFVAGCSASPPLYCPENGMTRAEGAVFVERGIHGGGYTPPTPGSQIFADVPLSEWYAKWATGLWDDGYTAGCGTDPLIYCPLITHSRAEGAVFYMRMLNGPSYTPPTPSVQIFADVPLTEWYAKWVNAAWEAGIVLPCATTPDLLYCPNDALDRSTAAYMMVQSKQLLGP